MSKPILVFSTTVAKETFSKFYRIKIFFRIALKSWEISLQVFNGISTFMGYVIPKPYLNCCILTPTPPNMPFQRRQKCIFHWRGRAWLTIWDRVKISRYSHRLMHRKRVTCELHDRYFLLMTIKHAIPKTAEETYSDGQLWGDIEQAIEQLYNSVKTGSQLVWRSDSLQPRCGREIQHPAESWALGSLVEQLWRTGKKRWWP